MRIAVQAAIPMEKGGGEGSRGGHITGHTKSGTPIYSSLGEWKPVAGGHALSTEKGEYHATWHSPGLSAHPEGMSIQFAPRQKSGMVDHSRAYHIGQAGSTMPGVHSMSPGDARAAVHRHHADRTAMERVRGITHHFMNDPHGDVGGKWEQASRHLDASRLAENAGDRVTSEKHEAAAHDVLDTIPGA